MRISAGIANISDVGKLGRRLLLLCIAVAAGTGAACNDDDDRRSESALCRAVKRVGDRPANAPTDEVGISTLVSALPARYKDDAALLYHPYGGSVAGLDTSGISADAAGHRLYEFYADACDYHGYYGPTQPDGSPIPGSGDNRTTTTP